jgi:rhodanese-related sulfurtransferase
MLKPLIASLLATIFAAAAEAQQPPAQGGKQVRTSPEIQQVKPIGEEKRVQSDDIDKMLADGKVVFLDIREPWELEDLGTHAAYVNIPLAELEQRLAELPKNKPILTA